MASTRTTETLERVSPAIEASASEESAEEIRAELEAVQAELGHIEEEARVAVRFYAEGQRERNARYMPLAYKKQKLETKLQVALEKETLHLAEIERERQIPSEDVKTKEIDFLRKELAKKTVQIQEETRLRTVAELEKRVSSEMQNKELAHLREELAKKGE